jgi:hypothetical protein
MAEKRTRAAVHSGIQEHRPLGGWRRVGVD